MVTINVTKATKKKFKKLKLEYSSNIREVTEDEFVNVLLENLESLKSLRGVREMKGGKK